MGTEWLQDLAQGGRALQACGGAVRRRGSVVVFRGDDDEAVGLGDRGGPSLNHLVLERRATRCGRRYRLIEKRHRKVAQIEQPRIDAIAEVPVDEWGRRQAPRRGEIVLQWGVSFSEDADYSAIADRSASLPIPPNLTARPRSAEAAPQRPSSAPQSTRPRRPGPGRSARLATPGQASRHRRTRAWVCR